MRFSEVIDREGFEHKVAESTPRWQQDMDSIFTAYALQRTGKHWTVKVVGLGLPVIEQVISGSWDKGEQAPCPDWFWALYTSVPRKPSMTEEQEGWEQ
jgi:hypothetical protein